MGICESIEETDNETTQREDEDEAVAEVVAAQDAGSETAGTSFHTPNHQVSAASLPLSSSLDDAASEARTSNKIAEGGKQPTVKEFTLVLLESNGNPGRTIQLERDLQQLQPPALREHICGLEELPESWRSAVCESDLVLSIGDAAISDEMNLHLNG